MGPLQLLRAIREMERDSIRPGFLLSPLQTLSLFFLSHSPSPPPQLFLAMKPEPDGSSPTFGPANKLPTIGLNPQLLLQWLLWSSLFPLQRQATLIKSPWHSLPAHWQRLVLLLLIPPPPWNPLYLLLGLTWPWFSLCRKSPGWMTLSGYMSPSQ